MITTLKDTDCDNVQKQIYGVFNEPSLQLRHIMKTADEFCWCEIA